VSWSKELHAMKLCTCGMKVTVSHLPRHYKGLWHTRYLELNDLKKRGMSFAEIGRQMKVSRVYILHLFRKVEGKK
jgi:hypothetical protein